MEITVEHKQERVPVAVLHVDGSIDSASYQQFEERAVEEISGGQHNLLIDLARVPYVSSAGLRSINAILRSLENAVPGAKVTNEAVLAGKAKSPNLKLLSPTPRVLEVLKMAGYDLFLEIHHNPKQAVASFQG
jgi:anti-anti-sigma factor